LIAISLNAQVAQFNVKEFAPVGAKWEYKIGAFDAPAFPCNTEVTKDTIIKEKRCSVLKSNCSYVPRKIMYLHSDGDKVFIYDRSEFQLLYDFSAKKGDSLTMWLPYENENCGQYSKGKVDSTTIINYGKYNYRAYWLSSPSQCNYFRRDYPIMERFGRLSYLLPTGLAVGVNLTNYSDNCVSASITNGNCPLASVCNLKVSYNSQCIMVATDELKSNNDIVTIFPNPAREFINIQISNIDKVNKIVLIEMNGRVIKNMVLSEMLHVDVSDVRSGIYIVAIHTKYNVFNVKVNISH
jgi:hypothetical protein